MKNIKFGFIFMCLITFVFVIVSCIIPFKNCWFGNEEYEEYNDGWQYEQADGVLVPAGIPGHIFRSSKDTTVMFNTLPEVEDGEVLAIYSHLQDVKVQVDHKDIQEYTNEDMRLIGKESPSAWIIVKLKANDSYKPIQIEFISQSRQNIMKSMYLGNETGIVFHIWQQNIMIYVIGIIISAVGAAFILFSVILGLTEKHSSSLRQILYLGTFCILIGIWFLCVNKARQFYVENIFLLHNMSYMLLMIYPIPFFAFVNEVEGKSEKKALPILEGAFCISFFVCMLLAITNICSLAQSFVFIHVLLEISILVLIFTLIRMIRSKKKDKILFMTASVVLIGWIFIGMILHVLGICRDLTLLLCQGVSLFVLITGIGAGIQLSEEHLQRKQVAAESEAKARFLANLSHELRTPMYAISGMADLLSESELSWDNQNRVSMIRHSTESMLSIINDIMDASKVVNSESKIVETDYELLPILQELMELTRYRVGEKDITIKCELKDKVPSVYYGDREKVRQVLNILLDRAAKYTYSGSIHLVVYYEEITNIEGNLCFKVTDTGIGIERNEMENMEDETEFLGTGFELGFINCKKIINKLNGKLKVDRESESGNTVSVSIPQLIMDMPPIIRTHLDEVDNKPKECVMKSIKAPNSKILVVDDNRVNLQVAQAMLRRYEGEVILADSGQKALDILREQRDIDLVFMDLMMPDMDGYETVKMIRSQFKKTYKKLPVIALTANAVGGTEERAYGAGMNAYMVKPVHTSELDQMLKTYLPQEKQVPIVTKEEAVWQENAKIHLEYQDFLNKLHGIHITEGLGYCMNKPEVYYAVLKAFATPQLKDQIAVAWENKDIKNYTIFMHSIKSSARNIGADYLSDMAYDLEQAAKNNDMDYLNKHHTVCMDEYDKIYRTVKTAISFMEQGKTEEPVKTRKLSATEMEYYKTKLLEALKNMDPIGSKEIIQELFYVEFEQSEKNECIKKIYEYVDNYDFEEAESALELVFN